MLYFNIEETFHARGIINVYRTFLDTGFSQGVAYNLANNQAATFRLSHVEKLRRILNCTLNDLIYFRQIKAVHFLPIMPL